MGVLNELGVKVDSSALPWRTKNNHGLSVDWSISPEVPYFLSMNEVHRLAHVGEESLGIFENPFSMIPTEAIYDPVRLKGCLNLSYWNSEIKEALLEYVRRYSHPPDEYKTFVFKRSGIERMLYNGKNFGKTGFGLSTQEHSL